MEAAFWKFAHSHYQGRKPLLIVDIAAFSWFGFFAFVYGTAFIAGWVPNVQEALVGLFMTGFPLMFGILHRRIRIEAAKAPDALYRKRIAMNR